MDATPRTGFGNNETASAAQHACAQECSMLARILRFSSQQDQTFAKARFSNVLVAGPRLPCVPPGALA